MLFRSDVKACQKGFTAAWDMTITPLDTCGVIGLGGDKFKAVRDSKDPVASALIENYRIWSNKRSKDELGGSSVLFDTVAVYLAFSTDALKMERLNIRVTDNAMTVMDQAGKAMQVATEWKDKPAFEDMLVRRLTGAGK